MKGLLIALFFMVASGSALAGDAWRWKVNGLWVYGDHYPVGAASLERVLAMGGVKDTKDGGFDAQQNEKASKLFPVVVYGVGCPGCEAAKKMLEDRKVPFTVKDPNVAEVYADFKKISPQSMAPAIMVGDRQFVGFDASGLSGALDDAGYAKTQSASAPVANGASIK